MRSLILAVIAPLLSGCTPPDSHAVMGRPAAPLATCGAERLSALLGQPVSTLPATGPWGSLRLIRPGTAITMDYSATRLNVRVDGAGKIRDLTCG